MKIKFPPFLKKNPFELFERFEKPIFTVLIIGCLLIRAWLFGSNNSTGDGFVIEIALGGLFFTELLIGATFLSMGGQRLSQLARYVILYLAFMPRLKYVYLTRITDFKILFEIREDLTNGKIKNAVVFWLPELSKYLVLLIPFIILLIMAVKTESDYFGNIKLFKFKYMVWVAIAAAVGVLLLPFGNLANIGSFVITFILISGIWRLWDAIRRRKSLEPMPVVAWAEILMFLAMLLKGIVESFS
ncbi:MAG: hypothetical protein K5669_11145 [Lachnospiraceae bacterium]|nr:hypothetical protein [Lachnospiraceae bacterium]